MQFCAIYMLFYGVLLYAIIRAILKLFSFILNVFDIYNFLYGLL